MPFVFGVLTECLADPARLVLLGAGRILGAGQTFGAG
jgi:hypothetical protein